jgi:hypothetical protein
MWRREYVYNVLLILLTFTLSKAKIKRINSEDVTNVGNTAYTYTVPSISPRRSEDGHSKKLRNFYNVVHFYAVPSVYLR